MDAWAVSYGSSAAFVCVCCAGPQLATQFGNELKLKHCHNTWVDQDDMPTWGQLGCNGLIVIDGADQVVCQASPAFLEVKGAAFRHVETLLDALIASKPAPTLKPGRVDPSVGGACAEVRFGADAADGASDEVIVGGLSSRPELNGKRGRVLSHASNGRVEVQIDGEPAPLSIKRQNLTPLGEAARGGEEMPERMRRAAERAAQPAESAPGEAAAPGVAPLGTIQSVSVAALDAEHDACAAALKQLADERSLAALDKVLSAYEAHFAHEEALLDEHLWKDAALAAKGGAEVSGFDAKASMRKTHLADHARMIKELAPGYTELARQTGGTVSRDAAVLPPGVVEKALRDFEAHANKFDSYGDELAAALERAGQTPSAVITVA